MAIIENIFKLKFPEIYYRISLDVQAAFIHNLLPWKNWVSLRHGFFKSWTNSGTNFENPLICDFKLHEISGFFTSFTRYYKIFNEKQSLYKINFPKTSLKIHKNPKKIHFSSKTSQESNGTFKFSIMTSTKISQKVSIIPISQKFKSYQSALELFSMLFAWRKKYPNKQ